MNEFELIDKYIKPITQGTPEALGLADDVAVVSLNDCAKRGDGLEAGPTSVQTFGNLVVTTDCLLENKHFFTGEDPRSIAYRLLASNVSDLASVGASPRFYTLTFCPSAIKDLACDWVTRFFESLKEFGNKFSLKLIGGNTAATGTKMFLSATVFGCSALLHNELPYRFNAKPEDEIFISSEVGGAYLGYRVIAHEKGLLPAPFWLSYCSKSERQKLVDYYYYPKISWKFGAKIAPLVNSCTDASDGMISSVLNICNASNLQGKLKISEDIFTAQGRKILLQATDQQKIELLHEMLNWGGDYNLVFTAPQKLFCAGMKDSCEDSSLTYQVIGKLFSNPQESTVGVEDAKPGSTPGSSTSDCLEIQMSSGLVINLKDMHHNTHK